jgi:hypothetical protein
MITILDVVISRLGQRDEYSKEDVERCGVPFFSGCQSCGSSLGPAQAYPSKTGFIRCTDCIDDLGFGSVGEFNRYTGR